MEEHSIETTFYGYVCPEGGISIWLEKPEGIDYVTVLCAHGDNITPLDILENETMLPGLVEDEWKVVYGDDS